MRHAALSLTVVLTCALVVPLPVHADDLVLDPSPSATGAERIFLAKNGPGALVAVATGEVADVPETADITTAAGGRLSWEVVGDRVDRIGHRHVTYQQVYHARGESGVPDAPVSGGRLTYHYDGQQELRAVIGARFGGADAVRVAALTTVEQAQASAWSAVDAAGAVSTAPLPSLAVDRLQELRDRTKLSLASTGTGRSFGYVWEAPVALANGGVRVAVVDAVDGRLLGLFDPNPDALCAADCSPATSCSDEDDAVVLAQNTSIANRSSEATPSTWWGSPYTHEAHRQPHGDIPEITVYRGVESGGCGPAGLWRILPLFTDNGQPLYGQSYVRKSAGDAMTKMVRVMEALESLGWQGINGSDDPVEVVVAGVCFNDEQERVYDNAKFIHVPENSAPTGSVLVCEADVFPREHSACLDVLAHEVGHGVVYASTDIDITSSAREYEFHEGLADFVGYAVEWLEGDESTQEQPDWTYREDISEERDVENDDGTGDLCFHYEETSTYCKPSQNPYARGNLIPVAYRLAAVGGANPICPGSWSAGNHPYGLDCDFEVDPLWQNFDANIIFATEVFFRILTEYMSASSEWDAIADYAKMAAHDLYRINEYHYCYDAVPEQQVVFDALKAVGIDGTPNWWSCVCEQNCHDEES